MNHLPVELWNIILKIKTRNAIKEQNRPYLCNIIDFGMITDRGCWIEYLWKLHCDNYNDYMNAMMELPEFYIYGTIIEDPPLKFVSGKARLYNNFLK